VDLPVAVADGVAVNVIITPTPYTLTHIIIILITSSISSNSGRRRRSSVIVTIITSLAPVTCIRNQQARS